MSVMSDFIDNNIGLRSMVKTYGWNNLLIDSILPALLAFLVTTASIAYCDDSHALFDKILTLCISILPSYLGLLVAAYTILLTLLTTEAVAKLKDIVDDENGNSGKRLIRTLNSDFAICILIAGFALLLSFLFSVNSSLKIDFIYADAVNYLLIFLMVFLLFFSLTILVNLIENLYNIGQTTTIL